MVELWKFKYKNVGSLELDFLRMEGIGIDI